MTGLQSNMTDVLIRRSRLQRFAHRKGPMRTQPDDSHVQAKMSGPQKKSNLISTLDLWECEQRNGCASAPPSLWYIVMPAPAN